MSVCENGVALPTVYHAARPRTRHFCANFPFAFLGENCYNDRINVQFAKRNDGAFSFFKEVWLCFRRAIRYCTPAGRLLRQELAAAQGVAVGDVTL